MSWLIVTYRASDRASDHAIGVALLLLPG